LSNSITVIHNFIMVKYFETSNVFNYTWDQVAKAFWRRYPNPYSTHVLSEDIIYREIQGEFLFTRRLMTKTNSVPKWGERFVKTTIVSIVEDSYINPKEKTIKTVTRNVGYTRVMGIIENAVYTTNPDNPSQTIVRRNAQVDSQIFGFRRAIEGFGVDRFRKNCNKAIQGFNHIMAILYPSQKSSSSQCLHVVPNTSMNVSHFSATA